jgi:hypothetical protein
MQIVQTNTGCRLVYDIGRRDEIILSWKDMAEIAIMLERQEIREEIENYLDESDLRALAASNGFLDDVIEKVRKIRIGHKSGDDINNAMEKLLEDLSKKE